MVDDDAPTFHAFVAARSISVECPEAPHCRELSRRCWRDGRLRPTRGLPTRTDHALEGKYRHNRPS